jgi:hypothetical protein
VISNEEKEVERRCGDSAWGTEVRGSAIKDRPMFGGES